MLKILTIIGARPQIIKAAAISRNIQLLNAEQGSVCPVIEERILHTGQHYDANMSQVFFTELGIPKPYYQLQVGSANHAAQTAKMIEGIEKVLLSDQFHGVLLYGDTNSTLAGAIAAAKVCVPIFHVEAGLRSYNMTMPEEINRVACDALSSLLFAPTKTAVNNLHNEGLQSTKATFLQGRHRKIILSGDVMYDNSVYFAQLAEQKSTILKQHALQTGRFVLATVHRASNTDNVVRLSAIFRAFIHLATQENQTIVLPLHPRTKKQMQALLPQALCHEIENCPNLRIIPPASFLDMIMLEKHAAMVLTDSGGVQKEAFFFEKPCLILRAETEWVELLEAGAGVLVDANQEAIIQAYQQFKNKSVAFPLLFGDAHAAAKIVQSIRDYLGDDCNK